MLQWTKIFRPCAEKKRKNKPAIE